MKRANDQRGGHIIQHIIDVIGSNIDQIIVIAAGIVLALIVLSVVAVLLFVAVAMVTLWMKLRSIQRDHAHERAERMRKQAERRNKQYIDGQEALEGELMAQEASCLLVSHDRSFVRAVGNRFLLIEKGRLVEVDGPEEFFEAARRQS